MSGKKMRTLRQKLKLKLPVKADLRIAKKVKKIAYILDRKTGLKVPTKVERVVIVNAAKYQYRAIKKIMKGVRQ